MNRHFQQSALILAITFIICVISFSINIPSTHALLPIDTPTSTIPPLTNAQPITAQNAHRLTALGVLPTSYWVTGVAFSPDNQMLAAVEDGTGIFLWDTQTWAKITLLPFETQGLDSTNAQFSPDGKFLVAANDIENNSIQVWDVKSALRQNPPKPIRKIPISYSFVTHISFHPDGKRIITLTYDGSMDIWGITTGQKLEHWEVNRVGRVDYAQFSPDGKLFVFAANDKIHILEMLASKLRELPFYVSGRFAFSPDGSILAFGTASIPAQIRLWDIKNNREIALLDAHDLPSIGPIAFSPDGKLLASGSIWRSLVLWDVATGRKLHVAETGGIRDLAFSLDGKYIATGHGGSGASDVILWGVR